jgi:uncharacterized membrane protein
MPSPKAMSKSRLEAFSDGVIVILITIMVLELKIPHGTALTDLKPMLPIFLTYVLSFVMLGIYWNNHHHVVHATDHINGRVLWANMHLLFWLSLIPFVTGWMGENHVEPLPTATYGAVLLMAGVAYYLLVRMLLALTGNTRLAHAIGQDWKGALSVVLYVVAIPLAFVNPWIAIGIYVLVAVTWFCPDPRIESRADPSRD